MSKLEYTYFYQLYLMMHVSFFFSGPTIKERMNEGIKRSSVDRYTYLSINLNGIHIHYFIDNAQPMFSRNGLDILTCKPQFYGKLSSY